MAEWYVLTQETDVEFIRADDNGTDLMLAICAMCFYVLGGIFGLISVVERGFIVPTLFVLMFGGVFHFIKVKSDGRVRAKRAQYVLRPERDGTDTNGGSC